MIPGNYFVRGPITALAVSVFPSTEWRTVKKISDAHGAYGEGLQEGLQHFTEEYKPGFSPKWLNYAELEAFPMPAANNNMEAICVVTLLPATCRKLYTRLPTEISVWVSYVMGLHAAEHPGVHFHQNCTLISKEEILRRNVEWGIPPSRECSGCNNKVNNNVNS